jgi:excisionase family DNA binding protein
MENENKKRMTIAELGDVVSIKELASLLGVSTRMVYEMAISGRIKSFKFNRLHLFLKKDVLDAIGYVEEPKAIEANVTSVSPLSGIEFQKEKSEGQPSLASIPTHRTGGYKSTNQLGA